MIHGRETEYYSLLVVVAVRLLPELLFQVLNVSTDRHLMWLRADDLVHRCYNSHRIKSRTHKTEGRRLERCIQGSYFVNSTRFYKLSLEVTRAISYSSA